MKSRSQAVCYLCGEPIADEDCSRDHVPPRDFYSAEIRRAHGPNLLTLPAHQSCNTSYQLDEEYFIHTFAPFIRDSYAGKSLLDQQLSRYAQGRNRPLMEGVLNRFETKPSGIVLPPKMVAMRFDVDFRAELTQRFHPNLTHPILA